VPQTSVGALFGPYDENLRHVEALLNVKIRTQGHELMVDGHPRDTARVERWVGQVSGLLGDGHSLSDTDIRTAAQLVSDNDAVDLHEHFLKGGQLRHAGKRRITAKSANQRLYLDAIEHHDIVFGIGPAGTGKTYLAMAQAVSALLAKKVARIVLARPAVEAGEKLGFLPGDLQEKVNPYLRPLYDALYDMLDVERAQRLLERGTIEVAPIAFMRGRTLNDAFVILDEAQNTTTEQMKMFLTRLGFGSKAVVTGDITQIDLPTRCGSCRASTASPSSISTNATWSATNSSRRSCAPTNRRRRRPRGPASRRWPEAAMAVPPRPATRLRVVVLAPDGARRPPGLGSWLAGVAPRAARGEVAVALVSDRRMRTLNRSFRGVDAVTDVLSFPAVAGGSLDGPAARASARRAAPAAGPTFLGDIVIAAGVATRQAATAGHALGTELRVLALHGLLHLLGYDHETDDGAMARTEQRLRRRGQLREGLIERARPAASRARR
jgi:phosphate starvation-inducible PhoH-like protein